MPRFDDVSFLDCNGSKNVRTLGEPKEFINLVENQSFRVMWTKTHVRKLKVKTLVDSGCSKTIFTDRSLLSDSTPYKTSIQTASGVIHSTGRGTVGNLQNCLYVSELNVNLISTSHACKSDNSLSFVNELGVLKIRDRLNRRPEYIYENVDDLCEVSDLRWLGINVLDDENKANMARDLDNSRRRFTKSTLLSWRSQSEGCLQTI